MVLIFHIFIHCLQDFILKALYKNSEIFLSYKIIDPFHIITNELYINHSVARM